MITCHEGRLLALLLCVASCQSAPVQCGKNCSTTTTESLDNGELTVEDDRHTTSHSNLAWLVTPALFALGVMYVIYKCCRDGLCNCKRLRRRAAAMGETSGGVSDHGYIPLSQVALYSSSQIPVPHSGVTGATSRRLLLVHNRTYCVTVDTVPDGRGRANRRILVQPLKPPTYEEALAQSGGVGDDPNLPACPPEYTSSGPPCYSIAMGEISPTPPLEDHLALESVISALESETNDLPIAFTANRRRHRSAQDAHVRRERHRNLSAQERRLWSRSEDNDNAEFRQRCFSFSALKDAFRRSNMDVQEREALLSNENQEENVFPSREVLSSPGPSILPLLPNTERAKTHTKTAKRVPQQVSFEVRILEDSESNESIDPHQTQDNTTRFSAIGAQLRQRHSSAPETNKSKQHRSRHSSGNT